MPELVLITSHGVKAAYLNQIGPPDAIQYGDLPDPTLGPREVLVEVAAVAVNHVDTFIRSGAYPTNMPLPFIVGRDMTGTVREVGPDVKSFKVGDRVWSNNQGYDGHQGTSAEYCAVNQDLLYPLPRNCTFVDAVAVLHASLTAVIGLVDRVGLKHGNAVLVNGGSGSVGWAVLQIAQAMVARVTVITRSAPRARWCEELGADRVIDRQSNAVSQGDPTRPCNVDVYWDVSGTANLDEAVEQLGNRGYLVITAGLSRRSGFPVGPFITRNASMTGFTVTGATDLELTRYAEILNHYLAKGLPKPKVHSVLPLSQAAEAHRLVESGVFGKIVLVPG